MKIVALALANVALADNPNATLTGTLHGGAGDHSFQVTPSVATDIDDISTTIENSIMTFSGSTLEMYSRAELTDIIGNFALYDASYVTLSQLLDTSLTQTNLTKIDIMPNEWGTIGNDGSLHKSFTLTQSKKITAMMCDNFEGASLGDITLTLEGDVVIKTNPNGGTFTTTIPPYTYTINTHDRATGGRKCGFEYTVTRLAYSVTACEDLDEDQQCTAVAGYDLIAPLDFAQRTNTYTVNGYAQDELIFLKAGNTVQHVAQVKPADVVVNDHGGSADITAFTQGQCDATLQVQQDCKFDELCFFSFTVGPCSITQWSTTDAELVVQPKTNTFSGLELWPSAVLPTTAIEADVSKITWFDPTSDPDDTASVAHNSAMQIHFPDLNEAGIEIYGPAQYMSDQQRGDDSYRIVGYVKFLEDVLDPNGDGITLDAKTFQAQSYVNITVVDPTIM